ncbi:MAG: hypothetical protein JO097_00275 [Acidobacteriaceae bacterium]|nr:hypothetical protein [Acidobacteriaceae bacterium]MBV9295979.1 hypothetical protein [Acidobacteriaceae bacterium]MBV9763795.1 hypothetical protein [Acidobacteriaceae bacterium]
MLNRIVIPLMMLPLAATSGTLSDEQIKLLQDPGGWEYITLSDADNGIQTKHTCFDGQPHPEECSGTLTLTTAKTFVQSVYVHGQGVQRHGTYELSGNEITLSDELGTKDGPYTVEIDTQAKSMIMRMTSVRIELELEKEYRKQKQGQTSSGRTRDLLAAR